MKFIFIFWIWFSTITLTVATLFCNVRESLSAEVVVTFIICMLVGFFVTLPTLPMTAFLAKCSRRIFFDEGYVYLAWSVFTGLLSWAYFFILLMIVHCELPQAAVTAIIPVGAFTVSAVAGYYFFLKKHKDLFS